MVYQLPAPSPKLTGGTYQRSGLKLSIASSSILRLRTIRGAVESGITSSNLVFQCK
jgi:hypothetical protein